MAVPEPFLLEIDRSAFMHAALARIFLIPCLPTDRLPAALIPRPSSVISNRTSPGERVNAIRPWRA